MNVHSNNPPPADPAQLSLALDTAGGSRLERLIFGHRIFVLLACALVTAALACAAQAAIPLTHRDAARTVTFATGHTKDGRLDLDFDQLARGGTIAIYMGVVTLPLLRDGLLAAGLSAQTPAALIERGGTRAQRLLKGTLDELVGSATAWSTDGPTLVLIGDVVGRQVVTRIPATAESY